MRTIRGVVFDMDGTLCLPQKQMFADMRAALGISKKVDILDHVHSLPSSQQEEAQESLRSIERKYMIHMVPQPGLNTLMDFIVEKKLPATILTRNFPIPVEHLRLNYLRGYHMDPILTRVFHPPKPAPDGLFFIAKKWGVNPHELVMVGDSKDDMVAGRRAGATTVLLENDDNQHLVEDKHTDFSIKSLPDLIPILNKYLV